MACVNSDVTGGWPVIVAGVTVRWYVLPGQKSVMYGSAASSRATLTTCAHGLFDGGIVSRWR